MGFFIHRFCLLFWTAFYRLLGGTIFASVGPGSRFQGWIDIPQRGGRIVIGRNVHFCRDVELSVAAGAQLIIGDGAFIGRETLISAHRRVVIGANVLIGEDVSIHDNDHRTTDPDRTIKDQGFDAEPLEIGDDSWIGAKCVLVRGSGMGRRCVLGAGAVLTRKLDAHTVAAGVPAVPISPHEPAQRPPGRIRFEARLLEARDHCPLCGANDPETAIPFPAIPIVHCERCGMLYSAKVWPPEIAHRYYEEHSGSRRHLLGQRLNAGMNLLALEKIMGPLTRKSVLDVGCGYGFFLEALRRQGHADLAGIEISRREISHAREVLALPFIHASLDELPEDRQFDLVTCFEVIEHIREPRPFLRAMLRRVAPGGALVVMTDNFASKPVRAMGCAFPKWIPHAHVCHFTAATLGACLTLAGAGDVDFHSYTPWEMSLLALKARLDAPKSPADCFNLEHILATETKRSLRGFHVRQGLGRLLTPRAIGSHADGSLIYAIAIQPAGEVVSTPSLRPSVAAIAS